MYMNFYKNFCKVFYKNFSIGFLHSSSLSTWTVLDGGEAQDGNSHRSCGPELRDGHRPPLTISQILSVECYVSICFMIFIYFPGFWNESSLIMLAIDHDLRLLESLDRSCQGLATWHAVVFLLSFLWLVESCSSNGNIFITVGATETPQDRKQSATVGHEKEMRRARTRKDQNISKHIKDTKEISCLKVSPVWRHHQHGSPHHAEGANVAIFVLCLTFC